VPIGVWVPLDHAEKERLLELARRERRRPRAQAAYLLSRLLRDAEAQTEPIPTTADESAPTNAQ
jgi:hypothetical protein